MGFWMVSGLCVDPSEERAAWLQFIHHHHTGTRTKQEEAAFGVFIWQQEKRDLKLSLKPKSGQKDFKRSRQEGRPQNENCRRSLSESTTTRGSISSL